MVDSGQNDDWLDAARRGDGLALAKLLALHHPQLWARADARMDPALKAKTSPDDLLQEVYLQVYRLIGNFENRGPGAFLGWVQRILDRKLIDARRAAHRRLRDVDREIGAGCNASDSSYCNLLDRLYADSGTPSRVVRRQEAVDALPACLVDLPEAQREVIRLRFIEGLCVADVARRLGKSEAAVVALGQRALAALRTSMDRRGEFSWGP